jgi:hypothetical protein
MIQYGKHNSIPANKGLSHCVTSRKVEVSIPDGVFSSRTMALRFDSASDKNEYHGYLLGVKSAGAWGWQPCHLHVYTVWKFLKAQPPEAFGEFLGLYRDNFTLYQLI